jgi:hypothetical protein
VYTPAAEAATVAAAEASAAMAVAVAAAVAAVAARPSDFPSSSAAASEQGLTCVHFSGQRDTFPVGYARWRQSVSDKKTAHSLMLCSVRYRMWRTQSQHSC